MRRGLYFLMVVILILRGVVGAAMAMGIAPPAQSPQDYAPRVVHPAAASDHAAHAMPAWSHHNTQVPFSSADNRASAGHVATAAACAHCDNDGAMDVYEAPAQGAHPATCSACDVCHSAMLGVAENALPLLATLGAPPRIGCVQFSNAPAALAVKPPIA